MPFELPLCNSGIGERRLGICAMSATIRLDPIIPAKGLFDVGRFNREVKGALDHAGNIIRDDFKATTGTWRSRPRFLKIGPRRTGDVLAVDVFTDNKIYLFLDKGTRKNYPIPKGGPGFLRFQSGYRAKTRVGVIGSRGGGASGPFVTARRVIHPGIQARNFSKTIAKRRQRNLVNLTRLAFNRSFRFGGVR